ncbi:MAG: precorrin-3B C(17)-methyltransferase [Candidatus Omnitrophica bacterium]|nr:precorrin-3B C(17)-methyltransferase [Candidatus Omnitrophota bacterium]
MRVIGRQEGRINIKKTDMERGNSRGRGGKLSIVGIGPGDKGQMSQGARRAIAGADCLVGYSTYIKLLGGASSGKEILSSGMTHEVERAAEAIEKARRGKAVCVISSGDPGVYGMAGVILELLGSADAGKIDIEIMPGIMSANACAALLGAPLMNDFAVISLSDLLTKWKDIEKRLGAAAKAGFVIVLHNPRSKSRTKPLAMAWDIIKRHRPPLTPVGIVRNAYRSGEVVKITRLKDAPTLRDIDMATTIIVGTSKTYVKNGYMITPRGYRFTPRQKTSPVKAGSFTGRTGR